MSPRREELPLNEMQKRFVDEYIIDPSNITACAKRAGYSPNSAGQMGSNLLKDPRVQAAIKEETGAAVQRTGITKERILLELAKIAFANVGDILTLDPVTKRMGIDPEKLTRETTASLQELSVTTGSRGTTVKVKQADKITALINMGKHLGMFKDQLEVSGNVSLQRLIEDSFKDEPSAIQNQPLEVIDTTYQEVPGSVESEQLELPI